MTNLSIYILGYNVIQTAQGRAASTHRKETGRIDKREKLRKRKGSRHKEGDILPRPGQLTSS